LDDHLLPVNSVNKNVFADLNWFPYWVEEDIAADNLKNKPGTNNMRRIVHIKVSCNI